MLLFDLYEIIKEFLEKIYPGLHKDFYKNNDSTDELEILFQKNLKS